MMAGSHLPRYLIRWKRGTGTDHRRFSADVSMGCGPSKATAEAVVETAPAKLMSPELAKAEREKARLERIGESPEPLPDFVPHPMFVIKSKRTSTYQKVFINVMHHELVPTDKRYVTRDEQWKVDKKGENCVVFTAVIPTSVDVAISKDPMVLPQVLAVTLRTPCPQLSRFVRLVSDCRLRLSYRSVRKLSTC
jgi:hypothetical protein